VTIIAAALDMHAHCPSMNILKALWSRNRERIVTCPDNHQPVGVRVSQRFAVTTCTRWPEKAGCDQACVPQIEASPEGTLVTNIVQRWYGEHDCAYCGKAISDIGGTVLPGLRTADGELMEWKDIAVDELPRVLAESIAVCATCELTEDFRLRFPERVVDRHRAVPHKRRVFAPGSNAVY
jgi:hypothetical protein